MPTPSPGAWACRRSSGTAARGGPARSGWASTRTATTGTTSAASTSTRRRRTATTCTSASTGRARGSGRASGRTRASLGHGGRRALAAQPDPHRGRPRPLHRLRRLRGHRARRVPARRGGQGRGRGPRRGADRRHRRGGAELPGERDPGRRRGRRPLPLAPAEEQPDQRQARGCDEDRRPGGGAPVAVSVLEVLHDRHGELLRREHVMRLVDPGRVGWKALVAGADAELLGGEHVVRLGDPARILGYSLLLLVHDLIVPQAPRATVADDGRGHPYRARGGRFSPAGKASARANRCPEHRPDGARRLLPELSVPLVQGGGGGAGDRSLRPRRPRDRLRDALQGMEVQVPDKPTGRLRRLSGALRRLGVALPAVLVLAGLAGLAVVFVGGGSDTPKGPPDTDPSLTPQAAKRAARKEEKSKGGHVVQLGGVGSQQTPSGDASDAAPSPGAPSDAQVRSDLREARA